MLNWRMKMILRKGRPDRGDEYDDILKTTWNQTVYLPFGYFVSFMGLESSQVLFEL